MYHEIKYIKIKELIKNIYHSNIKKSKYIKFLLKLYMHEPILKLINQKFEKNVDISSS